MIVQNEPAAQRRELTKAQKNLLESRLRTAQKMVEGKNGATVIPRCLRHNDAPLSFAQERLWFLDQLEPGNANYNLYQAVTLSGFLNFQVLERSLNEMIRRHEILRTNFEAREGSPVQAIKSQRSLKLSVVHLHPESAKGGDQELQDLLRKEVGRPFDLSKDLLLRAMIIRINGNEHALLLSMHHIISDGWSLDILFNELAAFYNSFCEDKPVALTELQIQYADFSAWEGSRLQDAALEKPLAYWKKQLSGDLSPLELPFDHSRSGASIMHGSTQTLRLPISLARDLKRIGQQEAATLFMTLMAAFQTLLHRYTGQENIPVGSCVAGRHQPELEPLIGFFINTLVFRGVLSGDLTFREFLGQMRETTLAAFAHQELPFEKLVKELQPERSLGRNPFFQVMFVFQNTRIESTSWTDLKLKPLDVHNGTAKFDLTLFVTETAKEMTVTLEYNSDLFESGTISRMLGHWQTLLHAIAIDPDQKISELPLLVSAERHQLLMEWNDTCTTYPRHQTITQLFEEQVKRTPNLPALTFGGRSLTYRELDLRSNQLANLLIGYGVGPDTLVAICMERSLELIVSLLSILKAQGAYVSLDPSYPKERLAFMLHDIRATALITQEKLREFVNELSAFPKTGSASDDSPHPHPSMIIDLDDNWKTIANQSMMAVASRITADNLAYVSYTSGSTGKPKGVCVPHRGVVRLVKQTNYATYEPGDVVLQSAPIAFDPSSMEIWGALLNGGNLVICSPGALTLAELGEVIQKSGITTLWLTTGLFHQMIDEQLESLKNVRQLLTGGDVLSPPHAAMALKNLPGTVITNGYGPTENTQYTSCFQMNGKLPKNRSVPIGRPIANTQIYILDTNLQLVPIGVPGEIYTGGDGLARNYWNRPELTAEKFIPNLFGNEPGARLYKTGDRAKWLSDGNIEFLGRVDRQVKIRGFRIELEEIETILMQHPGVREAVLMARNGKSDSKILVAYLAATRQSQPSPNELRQYLQRKLPDYMMPSAFVFLDDFPLNANGKVDRRALPEPGSVRNSTESNFVAPRDQIETELIVLWEKALGIQPVGIRDNFFELGGHSMLGMQLFARIEKRFGKKLPMASLFHAPTVEQLARQLREETPPVACSSLVAIQPRGAKPPIFFVHGVGGGNLWGYANLSLYLGNDQPIYGLESRAMRNLEEFTRIENMAEQYIKEIRTVQPQGPYYLGGYCFGGNVAYEIARQLQKQGETIAFMALFESVPANAVSRHRIPWWRPSFVVHFLQNTAYWIQDFLDLNAEERRDFIRRKACVMARQMWRRFARKSSGASPIDLQKVINTKLFSEKELALWTVHLASLRSYIPKPYDGPVTLFRTRSHPMLCSFDPRYGWGELAKSVEVVGIPGSHEKIFVEPHVRTAAAKLKTYLSQAQIKARTGILR